METHVKAYGYVRNTLGVKPGAGGVR